MKLIRKRNNKKYLFLLLALISLTNPIFAGYGGEGTKDKAEKISKFRTQELINYVNLTIYYLYSAENRNERHVILFKSCQKLLNSNKKTVKGKDKKNLTSCTNLMKMGTYTNVSSNVNSKSSLAGCKSGCDQLSFAYAATMSLFCTAAQKVAPAYTPTSRYTAPS